MSWFHRRSPKTPAPDAGPGAPVQPDEARPVIRQVPGVKVELLVTLPDGGKARSAHYARLGSAALGRTRIGARNLMLSLDAGADGALAVIGEIAADAALPARIVAPDGATTEWSVPVVDGTAKVRLAVHREDVPA